MPSQSFKALYRYMDLVGYESHQFTAPISEEQASDYEAGTTTINGHRWRIRTARITPTKPGGFVALWRRNSQGETEPFDSDENIAGLVVFIQEAERFGVFRFSSSHLKEQGITSSTMYPGKRGFRVYPQWSTSLNRQVLRAQQAQSPAFEFL